jgi:hypothetical protein
MDTFKNYITHKEDSDFLQLVDTFDTPQQEDTLKSIIHYGILFVKKMQKELNKSDVSSLLKDEMAKLKLDTQNMISQGVLTALSKNDKNIELVMNNAVDKLNPNIERVIQSVDSLTKKTTTSSSIGAIGEDLFETNFRLKYPNTEIINSTKVTTKDSADFVINTNPSILVELKTYSTVISEKEVAKFKRDVINSDKVGGIMMSAKTGIVYRKMCDLEVLENGSMIMYVPNAGLNWRIGLDVIEIFLEVLRLKKEMQQEVDIIPLLKDYTEELDNVREITDKLALLRKSYGKMRTTVINEINKIYMTIMNDETECKNIINNLVSKLKNKLDNYEKLNRLEYDTDHVNLLNYMYSQNKTKYHHNYVELYELVNDFNYLKMGLNRNDNSLVILDSDEKVMIAELVVKRYKLFVTIHIGENEMIPLNPRKMKIDKTSVTVDAGEIDIIKNIFQYKNELYEPIEYDNSDDYESGFEDDYESGFEDDYESGFEDDIGSSDTESDFNGDDFDSDIDMNIDVGLNEDVDTGDHVVNEQDIKGKYDMKNEINRAQQMGIKMNELNKLKQVIDFYENKQRMPNSREGKNYRCVLALKKMVRNGDIELSDEFKELIGVEKN